MFLRKLLDKDNRVGWILIDLIIVIIGVYCAFLIQSYSENAYNEREKMKVMKALKSELETFRIQMPEFADYMVTYYQENKDNPDIDLSQWRYIEPQYTYQIVEYAIGLENNDIIDFELYDRLQALFVAIKQLEHVERLSTHHAGLQKDLIPELPVEHELNLARRADNSYNLKRFFLFIRSRPSNLRRVAENSSKSLELINEELGPELCKEIERDIILRSLPRVKTLEQARALGAKLFPNFTQQEIDELYREAHSEGDPKK